MAEYHGSDIDGRRKALVRLLRVAFQKSRPGVHHNTPPFKQIRSCISLLHRAPDTVR